jgi:hypothetical protein
VKAKELFAGLRQADYRHDGGIRCLPHVKLPPMVAPADLTRLGWCDAQ